MAVPRISPRYFLIVLLIPLSFLSRAAVITVNSQSSFDSALNTISANDTIAWEDGTYQNIYMNIDISNVVVMAQNAGEVVLTGASWTVLKGDYITITGLQFLDGNIGTENVIESYGSYNHLDNINISGYTSYKYLVIRSECRYNKVTYCNFENRLNLDDKNILSVLVDDTNPGYHLIQYCSFKNFDGVGQDMGIEPIRIGLSTQGDFISKTVVEYCYFTQCNGDGEIVSNKARQNVFRYNTFEDNPKAEFVLRHGDEGIVYGNFFLGGMGGIRIKEGQNHVVYNNYFSGQTARSLILQNYNVDPLDNILIAYNTFAEGHLIRLGGAGSYPPSNVTLANNIIVRESGDLFYDPTGSEDYIGNIYQGQLGIADDPGLINQDPKLEINDFGYWSPAATSPAVDAAKEGYPAIPVYDGLDIDSDILLDLMKADRPSQITLKDVGAKEYGVGGSVQPHATERNTGPAYFRKKNRITVDPQGLGQIQLEPNLEEYESGSIVTITAIPNEGYEFYYWSGDKTSLMNPDTLIVNSDRHVLANFTSITGIDEVNSNSNLSYYPNPVQNLINLSITSTIGENLDLMLYDYRGKAIKKLETLTMSSIVEERSYDLSGLVDGIYFLGLEGSNTSSSLNTKAVKLIKN